MHITFPDGKDIRTEFLVMDGGKQMYSVVSAYQLTSPLTASDGTSCAQGCTLGINASTTSVLVGAQEEDR
ncbi:hypothetical protein QFZ97_000542 [Paraburkholderia youngii]